MKRKVISGVLAALISIALWLYVVTVVNPEWEETFHNIPVVLENEEILHERGLMLTTHESPKVTLKLSGNRTDMTKLNSSNISIRVDLSRIYSAGDQPVNYSIAYPEGVPSNAFEVLHQTEVVLPIVKRVTNDKIDVVFKPAAESPEGYEALLEGYQVKVEGPAEIVDRIQTAEISIDLSDKKATFRQEFDYVLLDGEGNKVESEWLTRGKADFTIMVQRVEDVELAVNVIGGDDWSLPKAPAVTFFAPTAEKIEMPIRIVGSGIDDLISAGLIQDGKLFIDTINITEQMGQADTTFDNGKVTVDKQNFELANWLKDQGITLDTQGIEKIGIFVKADAVRKPT